MKCASCDCFLSDREASRKGSVTGLSLDLCDRCLGTIPDLEYTEDPSLSDRVVIDVEEDTVTFDEDEDSNA